MADGRRKAKAAPKAKPPVQATCPECGTRMVRTISGVRCPRFSACGRGGLEETADKIPRKVRLASTSTARERTPVESG